MHDDNLAIMRICNDCKKTFITQSSIEQHIETTGHKDFVTNDISESERFSGPDAIAYTSLAGLYFPTPSALKTWSKYCSKLIFKRSIFGFAALSIA